MDYNCMDCCFKRTPYCDKCASVVTASGKRKKPSWFVPLEKGEKAFVTFFGTPPTEAESLQANLMAMLERGCPLEVSLVARYNRLVVSDEGVSNG